MGRTNESRCEGGAVVGAAARAVGGGGAGKAAAAIGVRAALSIRFTRCFVALAAVSVCSLADDGYTPVVAGMPIKKGVGNSLMDSLDSSCSPISWMNNTGTKGKAPVLDTLKKLKSPAECCTACSYQTSCKVWTYNALDTPPTCFLKGTPTQKIVPGKSPGKTTGINTAGPSPPPPPPAPGAPWQVFTADEVAECGDIRIPELTVTPSRLLLFAQCRTYLPGNLQKKKKNSSTRSPLLIPESNVGDNMIHATVISKMSTDNGRTWTNFTVHTPISFSHGAAIYDALAKQVVLQYQYHPNADPELNSTYFQRISADDGLTWGDRRDITNQLNGCNPFRPTEMQVESAGSKIQTRSGRLIYTGHSKNNDSCTWYSDDHGATYNVSNRFQGNEVSVAELAPGTLVMNGRGGSYSWNPHRTQYLSTDDGSTWGAGYKSQLTDNNNFGCEAALIAVKLTANGKPTTVLFFSEPVGNSRTNMTLRCSADGGATWPGSLLVNGGASAKYSAMVELPQPSSLPATTANASTPSAAFVASSGSSSGTAPVVQLLLVWETGDTMITQTVGVGWCTSSLPSMQVGRTSITKET